MKDYRRKIFFSNLNVFYSRKLHLLVFSNGNNYIHKDIPNNVRLFVSKKKKYIKICSNNFLSVTYYSHINNLVIGMKKNFSKKIELVGVGYKFDCNNSVLIIKCKFSHTILFIVPSIINIVILSNGKKMIMISRNKEILGNFANKIVGVNKINVYTSTGLKYKHEVINIKKRKKDEKSK